MRDVVDAVAGKRITTALPMTALVNWTQMDPSRNRLAAAHIAHRRQFFEPENS